MKICIAYPGTPKTIGSFINNHFEYLKPDVELYHQLYPVLINGKSIFLFPMNNWIFKTFVKNIFHKKYKELHKRSIVKLLKENKITIVLAEYGLIGVALYEACIEAKVPYVVHFHGYDAYKYDVIEGYGNDYKKMFEFAAGIIGVSDDMIKQLQFLGAPKNKLYKITYGVDVLRFKEVNASQNPPIFIAVGRFTPKKAPQLSIKAFSLVSAAFPEARLIMIGDGEMLKECKHLSKTLNVDDKIVFLGHQNFEKIAGIMQKARVFIQHSIRPESGDSEGSPNSILEAASSALPIVSTKHAGIIETVIHGKTGFLVNENDYEEMSFYMKKFLVNPEIATEMGRKGREHVLRNYRLKNQLEKLKEILRKCSL